MILKKLLTLALLAVPLFFTARTADAADDDGFFLLTVPLSGPLEKLGQSALQGAELALKALGGGYRLEVADEAREPREDLALEQALVAMGYFTESRFTADAPRYLYAKRPVLLPFLTTGEAAGQGPATFFRLMPTYQEQGRFMAMEILRLKKRPQRLLIVVGAGEPLAALATTLEETLSAPPKGEKPSATLKPLDSKAQVLVADPARLQDPAGDEELGQFRPDLVILAIDLGEALRLAPVLADDKLAKTPMWGGAYLGFREVGAAFTSLGLNLNLCLPTVNLADENSRPVQEFNRRFVSAYQTHPTWVSALAYDSLSLAIKAVASGGPEAALTNLSGEHHSLATYDLAPGGGGTPPMEFMPIKTETLGYLP